MAAETMRPGVDSCPEPAAIAAYLDGRLTDRERAGVAEHLASCEACYFVFTEAAQVRASEASRLETESRLRSRARPWWRAPKILLASGGLAVAASLVLAIGTGLVPWRSGDPPEFQALVAAVGTDRPVEPRLTGGFAYGTVRGELRGPTAATVSPDVRIAAATIEKKSVGSRSPQTLRALGVAYLVTGEVTRAVPVLEEALDQAGADARTLNDLAAAYLVRAARESQGQDLERALTAASRATNADPQLAEAWFNRAYALERLSLIDEARRAWEQYLALDSSSEWADEARQHVTQLTRKGS